jgi:transcriptional regulator with XRE-family HTH domain
MAIHLKTERLRRGWSQAELARQAQMNANTISLIESDRFRPYDSQLRKLALSHCHLRATQARNPRTFASPVIQPHLKPQRGMNSGRSAQS